MKSVQNPFLATAVAIGMIIGALTLAGCERKEKVLDIETPSGEVEVERSLEDGDVDVTVEEN